MSCNHILGTFDRDTNYDFYQTYLVSSIDCLEELTSLKKEGDRYKFCPYCGTNVEGLLEKRIQEINDEITKRKEEEKLAKEKAEELFNEEMKVLSADLKLNSLPDEGNFLLILNPFRKHDPRNMVVAGTKEYITRTCTQYLKEVSSSKDLIIQKVLKIPKVEEIHSTFNSLGFNQKYQDKLFQVFEKVDGKSTIRWDYSEGGGVIYVSSTIKDEDDEEYTTYDQILIHRLGEKMNIDFSLEEVQLK